MLIDTNVIICLTDAVQPYADQARGVDRFLCNDLRWRGTLAEELLLTFDAPG